LLLWKKVLATFWANFGKNFGEKFEHLATLALKPAKDYGYFTPARTSVTFQVE